MPFVISAAYGRYVEEYRKTDAELRALVVLPSPSPRQAEQIKFLLIERSEWAALLGRCPMFVSEAGA